MLLWEAGEDAPLRWPHSRDEALPAREAALAALLGDRRPPCCCGSCWSCLRKSSISSSIPCWTSSKRAMACINFARSMGLLSSSSTLSCAAAAGDCVTLPPLLPLPTALALAGGAVPGGQDCSEGLGDCD